MPQVNVGTVANDGTGDPLRTAFLKLNQAKSEDFNVQYYGAKGNGTTDDTVAFQAALDAAPGVIYVPAGTYPISSTLTVKTSTVIVGAENNLSIIKWTGSASGVLFSLTSVVRVRIQRLTCTTGVTGGTAIKIATVDDTTIDDVVFTGATATTGFATCIQVTGDGAVTSSFLTRIQNCRFDSFVTVAINIDHAVDTYLTCLSIYAGTNNATVNNIIIDTGATGVYGTDVICGWGLHGLVIRHTNQGGAYGGVTAFHFFEHLVLDTQVGGDAILFDSTLGPGTVSSAFVDCWCGASGLNQAMAVVTATANGLHISGGADISFHGRIRKVALNGILIDSANANRITIEPGTRCYANNQSNNADGHGLYISAAATNVTVSCIRSGNVVDTGGHQKYGVKVGAVNADQFQLTHCDLVTNETGPFSNGNAGAYVVLGNLPGSTVIGNVLWGSLLMANAPLYVGGMPFGLTVFTIPFNAALAIDASNGWAQKTTLTGATTVGVPTNPNNGQRLLLTFIQDGTGGRTVAWNAVFKQSWSDTGNTLNKRSSIAFVYDGTNWNQDGAQTPYV